MALWNEISFFPQAIKDHTSCSSLEMNHVHLDEVFAALQSEGVFMQFIGQKDKNLKDIYEGDILRQYIDGKELIGVMTWNNSRMQYGLDAEVDFEIAPNVEVTVKAQSDAPEIIGNIYENPELLK